MTCADAAQHPGNNYYVQQVTGTIQRASGFNAWVLQHGPLGYAGPFDWCAAKDYAAAHTESAIGHSPGKVAAAATKTVTGGLAGSLGVTGFHANNFLLRAVKIVIGSVLLVAGLMKMTGAGQDAAGILTRTAGRLPGVA